MDHQCQHVESGACADCHDPKRVPDRKRVAMRTANSRSGKFPPKTPSLLRAAMKANEPERTVSNAWTRVIGMTRNPPAFLPRQSQYLYL